MLKTKHLIFLLFSLLCLTNVAKADMKADFTIRTVVPDRPKGQQDMLNFAAAPIDTVRVGIIGLGMRGPGAVERLSNIPYAKVVALCDIDSARVKSAQKLLSENGGAPAAEYYGEEDSWKALVDSNDIDLIYICTDWSHHVPMSLYAMESGKHVACEVPTAHTLEEIWSLIDTSERTRKHIIMLENCCYDDFELNTQNMAQHGVFGEILHVEGSYIHNLYEFWPYYANDWRAKANKTMRGDIYATHGMGPVAQLLDLHRGDHLTTLVAMDTKSVGGPDYDEAHYGKRSEPWANGDHTMTIMRTANGKTIQIQHDVVNPRPYSRMYQITGNKGFANKYMKEGIALSQESMNSEEVPDHENLSHHSFLPDSQYKALMAKYEHPILKQIGEKAKEVGGHGGMDYVMDWRLIYCLHNGLPLDIDVYDMAEWCCLAPLGALSIENGNAPVEVPDFTRGGLDKIKGYRHAYICESPEAPAK